jgi:hypothetical protein
VPTIRRGHAKAYRFTYQSLLASLNEERSKIVTYPTGFEVRKNPIRKAVLPR